MSSVSLRYSTKQVKLSGNCIFGPVNQTQAMEDNGFGWFMVAPVCCRASSIPENHNIGQISRKHGPNQKELRDNVQKVWIYIEPSNLIQNM